MIIIIFSLIIIIIIVYVVVEEGQRESDKGHINLPKRLLKSRLFHVTALYTTILKRQTSFFGHTIRKALESITTGKVSGRRGRGKQRE